MKIVLLLIFIFFNLHSAECQYYAIIYGIEAGKSIKTKEQKIIKEEIKMICSLLYEKDLLKNYELNDFKDIYVDSCVYNLISNNFNH